jgi:hypothetical protein
MIIIKVPACGLLMVNAPSIRPTLVAFAIIFVLTTIMVALFTISHTYSHEIRATTWSTTDGKTWIAVEEGWILKHELRRWAKVFTIWRYDHCPTAHRLASLWSIIFSRGLASLRKALCTMCASIDRMTAFASIWFHL